MAKIVTLRKVYPGSSTLEEVLRSGGTADDVRLPKELGGGYMTNFEVIHQIHCLNLIRKATYYDYYKDKAIEFTCAPHTSRLHVSECFPAHEQASHLSRQRGFYLLTMDRRPLHRKKTRQNIICHADVGLVSQHWIKDYPRPYANFNTWHRCRNFDEILDMAYKHQVPNPLPENFTWPLLEGSKIWDAAPQPGEYEGMDPGFEAFNT